LIRDLVKVARLEVDWMPDDADQLEMFSKEWYNEYFRRAASSEAHSLFCERVYGKDLCQHGLMDMAELDFCVSLINPNSNILEVGCSNGYITEYIHDRTASSILGIDFSDVAIDQARQRTREKSDTLRFECVDLTTEVIPGSDYDCVILVDSIYFLGDFKDSLPRFREKLNASGQLILSVFQTKEEEDPDDILLPDHTFLAQALQELGLSYTWYDFTENVRAHGIKNHQVAQKLKKAFDHEGNQFLYEARVAENVYFKERAVRNELARFMYLVERNPIE
jgi:2-polyprenyl-3-methyl-5-hydroxy-6-metoxy-1,4-benzoquinol methylase